MECKLYEIQYDGKAETAFKWCLRNDRKDIRDPKAIPTDKHFNLTRHNFNWLAKFIMKEQLRNIHKTPMETLKKKD